MKWNRACPLDRPHLLVAASVLIAIMYFYSMSNRKMESFRSISDAKSPCIGLWAQLEKMRDVAVATRDEVLRQADAPNQFTGTEAFDPYEKAWDCHIEQRVGRLFGDGGKFVCGPDEYFRSRPCLVYSVGSAGDFSFETDVIRKFGCEVHTFDPTGYAEVWGKQAEEQGIHFHPWGLGGADTPESEAKPVGPNSYLSFERIASELGHINRRIDLLKIDCEGCEYEAFAQIWAHAASGKFSIGQVLVELHRPEFSKLTAYFNGASDAGFHVFHKERNHWGCSGWQCVEFSFIHREAAWDVYQFTHCHPHWNTTK